MLDKQVSREEHIRDVLGTSLLQVRRLEHKWVGGDFLDSLEDCRLDEGVFDGVR